MDGSLLTGRVGEDVDKEQGKLAARQVGLTMLSTLRAQLGSLDRVARVIKVLGMVERNARFWRTPLGDQWLQRALCRGVRQRAWHRRPQCSRHGLPPREHHRGDRSHSRAPSLIPGEPTSHGNPFRGDYRFHHAVVCAPRC